MIKIPFFNNNFLNNHLIYSLSFYLTFYLFYKFLLIYYFKVYQNIKINYYTSNNTLNNVFIAIKYYIQSQNIFKNKIYFIDLHFINFNDKYIYFTYDNYTFDFYCSENIMNNFCDYCIDNLLRNNNSIISYNNNDNNWNVVDQILNYNPILDYKILFKKICQDILQDIIEFEDIFYSSNFNKLNKKNKVYLLYGNKNTGKNTFIKELSHKFNKNIYYLNLNNYNEPSKLLHNIQYFNFILVINYDDTLFINIENIINEIMNNNVDGIIFVINNNYKIHKIKNLFDNIYEFNFCTIDKIKEIIYINFNKKISNEHFYNIKDYQYSLLYIYLMILTYNNLYFVLLYLNIKNDEYEINNLIVKYSENKINNLIYKLNNKNIIKLVNLTIILQFIYKELIVK